MEKSKERNKIYLVVLVLVVVVGFFSPSVSIPFVANIFSQVLQ